MQTFDFWGETICSIAWAGDLFFSVLILIEKFTMLTCNTSLFVFLFILWHFKKVSPTKLGSSEEEFEDNRTVFLCDVAAIKTCIVMVGSQ